MNTRSNNDIPSTTDPKAILDHALLPDAWLHDHSRICYDLSVYTRGSIQSLLRRAYQPSFLESMVWDPCLQHTHDQVEWLAQKVGLQAETSKPEYIRDRRTILLGQYSGTEKLRVQRALYRMGTYQNLDRWIKDHEPWDSGTGPATFRGLVAKHELWDNFVMFPAWEVDEMFDVGVLLTRLVRMAVLSAVHSTAARRLPEIVNGTNSGGWWTLFFRVYHND